MKLWNKTYLISVGMFMLIFYVVLFFLTAPSITAQLRSFRESALSEEYAISRALDSSLSLENTDRVQTATTFGDYYLKSGIYLYVGNQDRELYSSLPFLTDLKAGTSDTLTVDGNTYLVISDRLNSGWNFIYLKSMQDTVDQCVQRETVSVTIGLAVMLIITPTLYFVFKRINRPMERLAHELRTPLTAIAGWAQMLQVSRMSEEQQYEATQYIIEESKRLSDISQKLLTLSNLRDGDIDRQVIDSEDLFNSAKLTFSRVEYTVGWHKINADRTLMQSLINNLISNALKASSPDAVVELISNRGEIIVRDYGCGMSTRQLQYANHPNRSENPQRRSGFGLPLCHEIARIHGATLSFSSVEGEWTEAKISFTGT